MRLPATLAGKEGRAGLLLPLKCPGYNTFLRNFPLDVGGKMHIATFFIFLFFPQNLPKKKSFVPYIFSFLLFRDSGVYLHQIGLPGEKDLGEQAQAG